MFEPVHGKPDFPALETSIAGLWRDHAIYKKSLDRRRGAKRFVFFEGPPTANGMPHPGHCLTRTIKDLYPRYRTMRGEYCERKAGWDTHGLPVEVEVCKELGIHSKAEIEAYGVEPFIHKCQESVWRYMKEWEALTERIGFWIDLSDAYVTYHQSYVESVYVAFPLLDDAGTPTNRNLVAWTTTPWTLPANQFAAVKADLDYVVLLEAGVADAAEYIAPAFGEVDYTVLSAEQARFAEGDGPVLINCVAPDGTFTDAFPMGSGRFVKECDRDITRDLRTRGLLVHQEQYVHDYPFCWRADNDPLIQYPRQSWFIRTSQFRDEMLANNAQIDWLPEHIKDVARKELRPLFDADASSHRLPPGFFWWDAPSLSSSFPSHSPCHPAFVSTSSRSLRSCATAHPPATSHRSCRPAGIPCSPATS